MPSNKYVYRREFELFLSDFKDMKDSMKNLNEETGQLSKDLEVVKERQRIQGKVLWGILISTISSGIVLTIQLILRLV